MAEPRALDAAAIVGLLAEDDRRKAVAALELGATTIDGIVAATGLAPTAVVTAVGRLAEHGLVVQADGELHLLGAAFARAARDTLARPPSNEHDGTSPDVRKVLTAFVVDGRLVSIPTARSKRLIVLDRLAQDFEPGRRYREPMVNLILGKRHADTAALRRYLVDDEFLARESGEYWRIGGTTVAPEDPDGPNVDDE